MSLAQSLTPLASRAVVPFRYERLPSLVMPDPIVPDGVRPPRPGIEELFELRVATDDVTERDAFAVRWQVYCRELGYEPAEDFPDRLERDAADEHAVSVVAYYRATGEAVGCYRLLLADPARLAAPFHLEQVCRGLAPGKLPHDGARRLGFAEVSRFCIVAPFRHFTKTRDQLPPAGIPAERWAAEAHHRMNIGSLMWLSAARLAVDLRLDYILALMEPRLQLCARVIGFDFEAIGEGVDFRGLRRPYRIDRRALRALLQVPETASLLAGLTPAWRAQAARHPLLVNYLASLQPAPPDSGRLGAIA